MDFSTQSLSILSKPIDKIHVVVSASFSFLIRLILLFIENQNRITPRQKSERKPDG